MGDSKSTNPYPLHLLVALSRIALVDMMGPNLQTIIINRVPMDKNELVCLLLTQIDEVLIGSVW